MDSSSVWHSAFDYAHSIERDHDQDLTLDQRIQLAQAMALIAIGQELSAIHHAGINPKYDSGS